jgi:hypothetical protein
MKVKIKITHKGSLRALGYHAHNTSLSRHRSLSKAIKVFGYTELIHKLVAIRTLTKNKSPSVSEIYNRDIHYIQSKYTK